MFFHAYTHNWSNILASSNCTHMFIYKLCIWSFKLQSQIILLYGVDFSFCCVYMVNLNPNVISKQNCNIWIRPAFCNVTSNNASSGLKEIVIYQYLPFSTKIWWENLVPLWNYGPNVQWSLDTPLKENNSSNWGGVHIAFPKISSGTKGWHQQSP